MVNGKFTKEKTAFTGAVKASGSKRHRLQLKNINNFRKGW